MPDLIKRVIGVFKGFVESGLEFKADIVVPYHTEFTPVLGSFLLVEVSKERYLLGRITKFSPVGLMSTGEAEDYLARMSRAGRPVPEDVKEAKLRYNLNVKLLGALISEGKDQVRYQASMRKLPHLGAFVGTPDESTIRVICGLGIELEEQVAALGNLAFGDIVYDGDGEPDQPINFDLHRLIGRRTYIFAHAGYGKTNLVKLLITRLYSTDPDVGFLIFDPEGEYAFTDRKGRPGLVDLPELQDRVVVYTDRTVPKRYQRFLGGQVHLNLANFTPENVIKSCVPGEKWDHVWANTVRGLEQHEWGNLVRLLETEGYRSEPNQIKQIVKNAAGTTPPAIVNNIVPVARRLHDKDARMLEGVLWHLQRGHIVIVDISLMSSAHGRWIASLVMNEIFQSNQVNFTAGSTRELLNVVVVVEEAQTVLSGRSGDEDTIFVEWAKEGRKYSLGSILITQQPGAIPTELVSQGDNFFVFHLLSTEDLLSLKRANAHFSDDILAEILNEPIPGNAYLWSAPYQPFVIPMKVENFEKYAQKRIRSGAADPKTTAAEDFAERIPSLQSELDRTVREVLEEGSQVPVYSSVVSDSDSYEGKLAVKLWNLKFALGEALSSEAARVFAESLPDGKKVLPDATVFEALDRQNVGHEVRHSDKTPYLVFSSSALNIRKEARSETIHLQ